MGYFFNYSPSNSFFMKKQIFSIFLVFSFLSIFNFSCERDAAGDPDNESELITTVSITFTPATGAARTFKWADKDGAGGLAPVIESISLAANTNYTTSVNFLDESKSPALSITAEIQEESNDHLVCYTASGNGPTIQITDQDKKKNPLGLSGTAKTATAGSGSLKISLKHEPDKKSATPCSTGETDVEVTFPVTIN
jgi:hypothetical protein